ncbi:MAG: DNA polymerase/3'-5' exonuclease PolX [Planctomycetaceae bacterium]|nr:DNA polymerase/3'-5' exonuclease PolX [Planctomycetaceae bacterium]
MKNEQIASVFEHLADLLEIQGANPFRIRAYRNAARTISSTADSLSDQVASGTDLTNMAGIGKDLAKQIAEIIQTGQHAGLEKLKTEIPAGVLDMLRIPGVGPKKVAVFFHELKLKSLEDLKAAAEAGKLASLKGFGKKTEEAILRNIDQAAEAGKRISIADARNAAESIVADLLALPEVHQASVAGSCRRRKETCGDLDVLVTCSDSSVPMDALAAHPLVESVLQRGETKQRVRLTTGVEMDLRVVADESFGAALQYFTGSKEHNVVVRSRAKDLGLKVNEYGVFRGDQQIAGRTEEDVYSAVGLPWIPPELRENRREFEWADRHELPDLVTLEDIRGDMHMHTTASDGTAGIEEMAEAAKKRGLKYIAITDHSKRVSMANGLDSNRLRKHWDNIRTLRESIRGIDILCGIECDILEDATLDLPDDVLEEADWVIAVLHYGLKQPREQIMQRLMCAVRNPHVDIIGHPTGRLVGRRDGADVNMTDLFKAAADHQVMMEINAHPKRLDLDDIHAAAAKDFGIPIVISTDSHSVNGFDVMQYGVDQARRAGLTKDDVANTRTLAQFQKLLKRSTG